MHTRLSPEGMIAERLWMLTIPPKMKTLSLQQAAEWPTRGGGAEPPLMMGVTHFMLSVCRIVTSSSSSPPLCPLKAHIQSQQCEPQQACVCHAVSGYADFWSCLFLATSMLCAEACT